MRTGDGERAFTARVMTFTPSSVVPRTTAYGYVKPARTWEAISEVSGKVVYMDKDLKRGSFFRKGDLLLKIDTESYGLAERRGVADVMSIDAQLKELEQSKKNTERLLAIEKKSLAISAKELERKRELFKKGLVARSVLEKEEQTFLTRQTTVNNLQNSLDLIPSQKNALLAKKKSGESVVSERRLDVARTEVTAPFDCRISHVSTELDQYTVTGSIMVTAEGIDSVEIPVQVPPLEFLKLMPRQSKAIAKETISMDTLRRSIGISAKVLLTIDENIAADWDARFSRTSESLDADTGAITIYVAVDDPYGKVIPGRRPPLVTNMYVQVILSGLPVPGRFIIPRSALHQGNIYLCNGNNRLEIRKVPIDFVMEELAVLEKGVKADERVVLSDLVPAVDNMLIQPVEDDETKLRLHRLALGEAI